MVERRTAAAGARPAVPGAPRARRGRRAPRPTRRDQILEAAAAAFAERGFRAVTLRDIGAAVGVTGPAVYRHFASKQDVLGEMLVGVSEELLSGARQRVDLVTSAEAAVAALVAWHVDFALEHPELISVQARDFSSLRPRDRERVRRLQRAYVEVWVDAIARCARTADRRWALAAAHAVLGLINSTPFSARLEREAMRALLVEMALAALSPDTLAAAARPSVRRACAGGS
ncbi:MAG TPA: helix-turn-helix domain-containing protein [Acidimicrobiales bacterium]|nr:helix-turn-helix domain-containing protein [Acidimicrobiales bacterium]